MDKKMKITIWSDIACPYCYIGKKKLEKALAGFPHKENIEIVRKSYVLNPDLPKEALEIPYYQYLSDSWNMDLKEVEEQQNKVAALAAEQGLTFHLDKIVVANTMDALRLLKFAKQFELADVVEEALFQSYFVKGENISDRQLLLGIGINAGLSESLVSEMLDSDLFLDEIKTDMDEAEKYQLEYIPYYMFGENLIIQGSIGESEYVQIVQKAYHEWENKDVMNEGGNEPEIVKGKSCSPDGFCSL